MYAVHNTQIINIRYNNDTFPFPNPTLVGVVRVVGWNCASAFGLLGLCFP
jgi:hypothetical protein